MSAESFQKIDLLSQNLEYAKSLMVKERNGESVITPSIKRRSWTKPLDADNNVDDVLRPLFDQHIADQGISLSSELADQCFLETSITKYKYQDVGFLDWHVDVLEMQDIPRVYTMSLFLNSDYEGGTLEIRAGNQTFAFDQYAENTCVIFPSTLSHRVTQVTQGCRRVAVCWFHCPEPEKLLA